MPSVYLLFFPKYSGTQLPMLLQQSRLQKKLIIRHYSLGEQDRFGLLRVVSWPSSSRGHLDCVCWKVPTVAARSPDVESCFKALREHSRSAMAPAPL